MDRESKKLTKKLLSHKGEKAKIRFWEHSEDFRSHNWKTGIILPTPTYDNRTPVCLAYDTKSPIYHPKDQTKPIGNAIEYIGLMPKFIEKISEEEDHIKVEYFGSSLLYIGSIYVINDMIKVKKRLHELGIAEKNNIYLSEKLFDMGRREIASTIIEENEHLITGFEDETRKFQNHFINKYLAEMEERQGCFL